MSTSLLRDTIKQQRAIIYKLQTENAKLHGNERELSRVVSEKDTAQRVVQKEKP